MTNLNIDELKKRVLEASALLKIAQDNLHAAQILQCGVALGDIVTYKGIEHLVTKIDPWWKKPWLQGNPKRKDGSFGRKVVHMYDKWEKK